MLVVIRDDVMMETNESMHSFDNWNSVQASIGQMTAKKRNIDWSKMVPCLLGNHITSALQTALHSFAETQMDSCTCAAATKPRLLPFHARRLDEAHSTDTVDSSVPAVAGGKTSAQTFVGVKSTCVSICGMHSVSEFPEVLKDFVLNTGAPHALISDNHNEETGEKVKKMLREHGIKRRT